MAKRGADSPPQATALDLVARAAAKEDLTPSEAMIALSRVVLHYAVADPDHLSTMQTALGHTIQGLAKVASSSEGESSDEGAVLAKFFGHG